MSLFFCIFMLKLKHSDLGLLYKTQIENTHYGETSGISRRREQKNLPKRSRSALEDCSVTNANSYTGCLWENIYNLSFPMHEGELVFVSCTFTKCASSEGGCIYVDGSFLQINDCKFQQCKSATKGGTICVYGISRKPKLLLCNSYFIECTSPNDGGAIYQETSDATIVSVVAQGCEANRGGFCYFDAFVSPTLEDINMTECLAVNEGGCIHVFSGECSIKSANFVDCYAKYGSVTAQNATDSVMTIETITVTGCYTEADGGAFFVNNGGFFLENGTVSECNGTYGGVLYLYYVCDAVVKNVDVVGCYSKQNGGCIDVNNGTCLVEACTFTNSGCYYMGGVFFQYSPTASLTVRNVHACGFKAVYGGVLFLVDGRCDVISSVFSNGSTTSGCVVYQYTPTSLLVMKDVNVSNCWSSIYGGFVTTENGNSDIDSCRLVNCSAVQCGGGIYQYASGFTVALKAITVVECSAVNGGFLLVEMGNAVILGGTFERCSADHGSICSQVKVSTTIEITDIAVTDCSAGCGGIYTRNGKVKVNMSSLSRCRAERGSVIYTGEDSGNVLSLDVAECTFNDCRADDYGGVISAFTSVQNSVTILNCRAVNCSSGYGGFVYINSPVVFLMDSCVFEKCCADRVAALLSFNADTGDVTVTNCAAFDCTCGDDAAILLCRVSAGSLMVRNLYCVGCHGNRDLAGNMICIEESPDLARSFIEICIPSCQPKDVSGIEFQQIDWKCALVTEPCENLQRTSPILLTCFGFLYPVLCVL